MATMFAWQPLCNILRHCPHSVWIITNLECKRTLKESDSAKMSCIFYIYYFCIASFASGLILCRLIHWDTGSNILIRWLNKQTVNSSHPGSIWLLHEDQCVTKINFILYFRNDKMLIIYWWQMSLMWQYKWFEYWFF